MVGGDAVSQYGDDGSIAELQTLCTQCAAHPQSPSIFSQFEIKWSHLTSTKPRCYQDSKGANQMLLGQPGSKVLARLFGPWCFTKKKRIIQKCLAEPLTFFGANCCRKLSIAACLRLGCSAVIAHYLSIFATTLQYFCNSILHFLQHVPSTLRLNRTPLVQKT